MVDPRTSQFWQAVVQGGLVSPEKLEECWEAIPADKRVREALDRRLARQAVNSGLLTIWQAQQILAGRQIGLRIDRYVVLDQIGQGGMGRVYLARDTRLGRLVALKVLARERIGNPRAVARFRREAKLGAQLQHENVIRVYDDGEIGGMPYLVMEYITGKTVAQLISEQGRLPAADATELTRQVALGLEHLHQKDLLHRDVNPSNILVDQEGTAKLTDLGLAIDLGDEEEIVTRDGATVGTFDYISPEQARNPRQIDTRSDIYSLGCSLYHMLAGRVPFTAPSLPEKLFAHQSGLPDPLHTLVPDLPEGLEAVVATMMNKRPEDRYPRPVAVARALEPFAQHDRKALFRSAPAAQPEEFDPSASQLAPADASDSELLTNALAVEAEEPVEVTPEDVTDAPLPGFNLQLDLSTEPTRSRALTKSAVRANSQSGSGDEKEKARPPASWWKATSITLSSLLILGALAVVLWPASSDPGQGDSGTVSKSRAPKAVPPARPADSARPFLVRFGRDNVLAEATLAEAIRRSAGKTAEILIHDTQPVRLELDEPIAVSGNLTLKAAPGNRPRLEIEFKKPVSFLEGAPQSTLKLEGLSIVASYQEAPSTETAVIQAQGTLSLDQCEIEGQNLPSVVHAIQAEGAKLSLNRCLIQGFSNPVHWRAHPLAEATLENTLLVGSGPNPWPLVAEVEEGRRKGKRQLQINHCTWIGSGMVQIKGGKTEAPLEIRVRSSITVGRWLVDWQGAEPFPNGLSWSGEENLYDLGGEGWIARPDESPDSIPLGGRAHKLDTWASKDHPMIKERGSQARGVEFATMPPGKGRTPADHELKSGAGFLEPWPGIEPERLPVPAK